MTDNIEILRLSKDGILANPEIPADEAAKLVLEAIDYNIKVMVQKAVEDEREACAQVAMRVAVNGIETSAAIRARGQA